MAESQNEQTTLTEDESLEAMFSGIAKTIEEKGMKAWVFSNDKTNPSPFGLLNMFYAGVFSNTLGLMVAKDKRTGDLRSVLVGIAKGENGEPSIYPVALILSDEDAQNYLPPNGTGDYIDYPDTADTAA